MDVYVNNTNGAGAFHDLFYTDPKIINNFMDYITSVTSRYKNSPAILAWEIANEARCSGTGPNPQSPGCKASVLTGWADTISTHIKAVDPNHLVGSWILPLSQALMVLCLGGFGL